MPTPDDFKSRAEESLRQTRHVFEQSFGEKQEPGPNQIPNPDADPVKDWANRIIETEGRWPTLDDVPVDVRLVFLAVQDRTRQKPPRTTVQRLATARAIVREHSEDDSLWPRLLATYTQLRRTGARGFLRGTEIAPEHYRSIIGALPPVGTLRKLAR